MTFSFLSIHCSAIFLTFPVDGFCGLLRHVHITHENMTTYEIEINTTKIKR